MNEEMIKAIYDSLLENDELFYGLTGDWEKDRKRFIKMYKDNQDLIGE